MSGNSQRRLALTGLGASTGLFYVFKVFYPYPNMVMDSYVYLKAAVNHLGANSFPIGYSKFLEAFIWIGLSGSAIVWIQFLILESACGMLFFTVRHFFSISRFPSALLWLFFFCNPLLFYMSNFIMSDTLFTALSLFWVVQLIWVIARPKPYMIWLHALLLVLVFSIRYNALYYPLISLVAILVGSYKVRDKAVAILVPVALLGGFVLYTMMEMRQLSGVSQFSPFGGWQLANNALYMYGHIYRDEPADFDGELGRVDLAVRRYFDSTHRVESLLEYNANESGFYYSADAESPLLLYMNAKYGPDTIFQDFRKWGPMGVLYAEYGSKLIRNHPLEYARYFAWPNAIRYFYPPEEIFAKYSPYFFRHDGFGRMARAALGVRTLTVGMGLIQARNSILSRYPAFFMLLNIAFVLALVGLWWTGGGRRLDGPQRWIVWVIVMLCTCNFLFSITASCIVLRYQIFIMLIEFAFAVIAADWIWTKF